MSVTMSPPRRFSTRYTPPSTPVTNTLCVSRYAQNVIANQRRLFVKPPIAELARMWEKSVEDFMKLLNRMSIYSYNFVTICLEKSSSSVRVVFSRSHGRQSHLWQQVRWWFMGCWWWWWGFISQENKHIQYSFHSLSHHILSRLFMVNKKNQLYLHLDYYSDGS